MRAILTKAPARSAIVIAALVAFAFHSANGQGSASKASAGARSGGSTNADDATRNGAADVAKTLKTAAEALGLARWSGVGGQHLPEVDIVSTMEIWGTGTTWGRGEAYKTGQPWPAFKTEYHAALGYNPAAFRLEMTRTAVDAPAPGGGAPQHTIQTVREAFAWDESEIGAGLIAGKGTATPMMDAVKYRSLQLWVLPYGVIKAALAAGDKTKLSTENGATTISFPLSGTLAGVMLKATLDGQNMIAKVETQADSAALSDLNTETVYSEYADHGEIATDVKSPGHIVRKQNGHPLLDLQVKMVDANNPYLVFPVPENVKKAEAR
ncbi:MAG TPA: hypothetical protein VE263_05555 [Candidatus Angelobacter sp.]|nr:hypothetical protein [Candidatus Angelobacter sp.]